MKTVMHTDFFIVDYMFYCNFGQKRLLNDECNKSLQRNWLTFPGLNNRPTAQAAVMSSHDEDHSFHFICCETRKLEECRELLAASLSPERLYLFTLSYVTVSAASLGFGRSVGPTTR